MKGIFLKESLKLIINIILVVGAAMMIIEAIAGQRDEQTMASEEKKIYTIEDIVPAVIYEDFRVNFKEIDL